MLYCDAITDAITKGLGQQHICVRYNIVTSLLDVIFLYLLLPRYGMKGYYISFFLTHLLNFILSLRLLLKTIGLKLPAYHAILSFGAMGFSILAAMWTMTAVATAISYLLILGSLLFLFQVLQREDLRWICSLIIKEKRSKSTP